MRRGRDRVRAAPEEQPPVEPPVRLVGVRELAAALGCSEREAYRVGHRVPHYVVGRMLRWQLAEVLAALREEPEERP